MYNNIPKFQSDEVIKNRLLCQLTKKGSKFVHLVRPLAYTGTPHKKYCETNVY